jgi:MFS superfamily sulfate permease-like transporter
MLTVLFLTPLFTDLPKPILSAIIIVAVSTLVDLKEFTHLWRVDKRDFALLLCAFTCTLFWGFVARVSFFFISVWAIIMTRVLFSILVSAALAVVLLVQRSSDPHSAVLVQVR